MTTFMRWCGLVLLALLALVVGFYVLHGLIATVALVGAKNDAADDLAAALPSARTQADRDRDAVRATTGAWGTPAYSWQELSCELDSIDSGWIAVSFEQHCEVRSTDLIPVTDPSVLQTGHGYARAEVPEAARCKPVIGRDAPRVDGRFLPVDARVGPVTSFADPDRLDLGCPDGIFAPSRSASSLLLTGARPDPEGTGGAAVNDDTWAAMTVSTDVVTSELGCHPWVPLLCTEPVIKPVLGDPDDLG